MLGWAREEEHVYNITLGLRIAALDPAKRPNGWISKELMMVEVAKD